LDFETAVKLRLYQTIADTTVFSRIGLPGPFWDPKSDQRRRT
jgi:hypothetical protein